MPIFKATVTVMVPSYIDADVDVEAASQEEAEDIIHAMYDNDELCFGQPMPDWDEADIDLIRFDDEDDA